MSSAPEARTVPASGCHVVLDASVVVDLLAETTLASAVRARLTGTVMHAPAHLDVEVASVLDRLERAEILDAARARAALESLSRMPLERHELPGIADGAWRRRQLLRLSDAFYVELASQLGMPLLTTDLRLARAAPEAEAISP